MNPERMRNPAEEMKPSHAESGASQDGHEAATSGTFKIDREELTRKLQAAEARRDEETRKMQEAEDAIEAAFMKRGDEITDAAESGIALTPTATEAAGDKNYAEHAAKTEAAENAQLEADLKAQKERHGEEMDAAMKDIEDDVKKGLDAGLEYDTKK